jgi:hypothetical protein
VCVCLVCVCVSVRARLDEGGEKRTPWLVWATRRVAVGRPQVGKEACVATTRGAGHRSMMLARAHTKARGATSRENSLCRESSHCALVLLQHRTTRKRMFCGWTMRADAARFMHARAYFLQRRSVPTCVGTAREVKKKVQSCTTVGHTPGHVSKKYVVLLLLPPCCF